MTSVNPYQSPTIYPEEVDSPVRRSAARHTGGTIMARYFAATIDMTLAPILAIVAALVLPERIQVLQGPVAILVWFGYYLVPEGLFGQTLGKLFTGLCVVQLDGSHITWWQASIRTAFRIIDVNPFLLGGLPAAVCVLLSRDRQRFGDKVAKTLVIPVRFLQHKQAAPR